MARSHNTIHSFYEMWESISIIQYDIHTRCWQSPTEHQTLSCTVWKRVGRKSKNKKKRVWLAPWLSSPSLLLRLRIRMCLVNVCMSHVHVGREEFTLDERILSLPTETWGSKEFTSMLPNLNGCQHSYRSSLHGNVTVRPVSKENTNMSCISHLWDSYFLS